MDNIRIELHFVNFDTPFPNGVWVSVNRNLLSTVNDFKCFLNKKFKFLDLRNMNLYVKTCLLPDDETILILRDEDVIRVMYEEQISFFDCCHNGNGEKVNSNIKNNENSVNLKRKIDGEVHPLTKRQKLLSPSIYHSLGSTRSDSEAPCSSSNSANLSINKQQEPISDLPAYTMQNSKKHKRKKKKSKRSKQDCDTPKHTVDTVGDMHCDIREGIVDSKQDCNAPRHTVGTVEDKNYDIREGIVDSKQDCDAPKHTVGAAEDMRCDIREGIVDAVCEIISSFPKNIKTQGISEHKSRKICKKKKKEMQSYEEANAMNQEIGVNYSLLSLGCRETKTKEINDDLPMKWNSQTSCKDDSKNNTMEESPVKLNSPTLSKRDGNENANEAEKDVIVELNNQSSSKTDLNVSLGNNCQKKKRKRKRRRKSNSILTNNDGSLNANTCSKGITSSTPKLTTGLQSFQPVLNYIGFGSNANIPAPKHTFFKEELDDRSSSPQCEQQSDAPKLFNPIEEPYEILNNTVLDSSTQQHADLQVLESSNIVQSQAFVNNVTIPKSPSVVVQEQFGKKLENGTTHTEGCLPQDSLKTSYSDYPPLNSFPSVGSIIAYKILELSLSYCPEISDYKEGKIVNASNDTDDLEIELANVEIMAREGKFENIYPDQIPEAQVLKKVTVNWNALIEPRLIHRSN